jgi:hypothetical protein
MLLLCFPGGENGYEYETRATRLQAEKRLADNPAVLREKDKYTGRFDEMINLMFLVESFQSMSTVVQYLTLG